MPGSHKIGAQLSRPFEKRAEFYLPVTQHVRIGRAAFSVILEKTRKHTFHILFRKIYGIIWNAQRRTYASDVGIVVFSGTSAVFVLFFPIAHEQSYNIIPLFLQQKSSHTAVHTAAEPHYDSFHFFSFSFAAFSALRRSLRRVILSFRSSKPPSLSFSV